VDSVCFCWKLIKYLCIKVARADLMSMLWNLFSSPFTVKTKFHNIDTKLALATLIFKYFIIFQRKHIKSIYLKVVSMSIHAHTAMASLFRFSNISLQNRTTYNRLPSIFLALALLTYVRLTWKTCHVQTI